MMHREHLRAFPERVVVTRQRHLISHEKGIVEEGL